MSESAHLSQTAAKTQKGRGIFNEEAREHEGDMQESVTKLIPVLRKEFPNIEFVWKKKITKREIVSKVNPKVPYSSEVAASFVSPDGGVVYAIINGKKYPILISEAKKQGTHFWESDGMTLKKNLTKKQRALALSGKEQGRGNAIERAYKNIDEFKLFCEDLNYFPYVLFACGKDFESGSSILDRLDAMTRYEPRNVNYVADSKQKVTAYVQEDYFTEYDMFDKIYNVAKTSLKCIGV
jgi:type II restriction enzyme